MRHRFEGLHPGVTLLYFAGVLGCTMVCKHPIYLAISLCCAVGYGIWLRGKDGVRFFAGVVLPVIILSTAVNGLFSHYGVTPLLRLPSGNRITLEALSQGAVLGGIFGAVSMWLYCFSFVLGQDKLLYLGSKCMPALSLVMTMALRFVPTYDAQAKRIARAHKGLHGDQSLKGFQAKAKQGTRLLSVLTTWALENSMQTADSMRARGYGCAKRTTYKKYPFTLREIGILSVSLLLLAACIILAAAGAWKVQYNPVIRLPKPQGCYIVGYGLYAVLCSLPLLTDWRGEWKWQRYLSKI